MNDSNDTSVAGGAAGADSRVLSADSALTERQRTILDVIRASVTSRGYPPSIREIGDAVGLTSTSSVAHQLRTLERKATYAVTRTAPAPSMCAVPTTPPYRR